MIPRTDERSWPWTRASRRFSLGLLLLAVIVHSGSGRPAAAQAPASGELLRWKFQPGETLRYAMVQSIVQETRDRNRSMKLTMDQTVDLHWTVKSVSPEGVADMSWTIDRVRAKIDAPGGGFEFDSKSEKADEGPLAAQLTPMLKAMIGAQFTLKMNGRGEYSDINVPQSVVDTLRQAGPGPQGGATEPDENLKTLINQVNLVFPAEPLAKGGSWTGQSRFPTPILGTVIWDKRFTFEGNDPKTPALRKIALDTKVTLEPAADSPVTVKVTSVQRKGDYTFDPQAGRIVTSAVKESLQISFSAQGATTQQSTETVTKMTLDPSPEAK